MQTLREEAQRFSIGTTKLYHGLALVLLLLFISQYVTGALLSSIFWLCISGGSWEQLGEFWSQYWYVWLIRDVHMLGANILFMILYLHLMKGIYVKARALSKVLLYVIGMAILLVLLAVGFTGYVLVTGQMSYWALTVILNILTTLPIIDDSILEGALGGKLINTITLRRFFALHWILASIGLLSVLLHITLLHRDIPTSIWTNNIGDSLIDVLIKDSIAIPMIVSSLIIFSLCYLIHPDNWQSYDLLRTPAHIEPEPYFLWLFCILKSRPSKVIGTLSLWFLAGIYSFEFNK